jgi:hypothetical protein
MSNDYELPPMPEPSGPDVGWFTEDQMREYAIRAVQEDRGRRGPTADDLLDAMDTGPR